MAKRTRQRQLKKLAERRALDRRRRDRRKAILAGVVIVALVAGAAAGALALLGGGGDRASEAAPPPGEIACGGETPAAAAEEKPQFDEPPAMQLEEGRDYRAVIETSCGRIEVNLFEDQTPITVNNFVFLAEQGFFDGLTFHRIISTFMIQGGDPEGDGSGGPGYAFEDEMVPGLRFDEPGRLAMANTGEPDSNGSQWFITVDPAPHLDPPQARHSIFGEVTAGMNVVRRINVLPVRADGETPTATVYIERVRIRTS